MSRTLRVYANDINCADLGNQLRLQFLGADSAYAYVICIGIRTKVFEIPFGIPELKANDLSVCSLWSPPFMQWIVLNFNL